MASRSSTITFNNVKFGEVTIDQRDVLEFPYGLPGLSACNLDSSKQRGSSLTALFFDEPRLDSYLNPMLSGPTTIPT